jgi:hypothetical protein
MHSLGFASGAEVSEFELYIPEDQLLTPEVFNTEPSPKFGFPAWYDKFIVLRLKVLS